MSETQLGVDEYPLDIKKMTKVLSGLPLPAEAKADLEAALAALGK
jgi:hypothetical protein